MNLNPTEQIILEAFNEVKGKPLTSWQVVEAIGKNYSYTKQCLWTLQKRGLLKKVRRGKTVFYYPNSEYYKQRPISNFIKKDNL